MQQHEGFVASTRSTLLVGNSQSRFDFKRKDNGQ